MSIELPNRRILVVDDNASIRHDFQKILQVDTKSEDLDQAQSALFGAPSTSQHHESFDLHYASQGQAALEQVEAALKEDKPYAMAFVDMRMPPGWDGVETIEHLWKADTRLQIVICTAYSDPPWDEIQDRIGRNDKLLILQKPFNSIAVTQLATALCRKWDLTSKVARQMDELNQLVQERTAELQRANHLLTDTNSTLVRTVADLETAQTKILQQNRELERLASRDSLTGCLNRRAFYAAFEQAFSTSQPQSSDLCCLMVDIDHFKSVNDRFGHVVGDQAIQAVANCLRTSLRLTDTVGRYGGEEFCLMFQGTTLMEGAELAERLRIRIEKEASMRIRVASGLVITVSIGVSAMSLGAQTPLELIDQADKALYAAKEGGRNCVMALDVLMPGMEPSNQLELPVKRITPRTVSSPAV